MHLSKRIILRGYTLILFLLMAFSSSGQSFRHITASSGLSSRRVYSITKDKEGYMWFLTSNGIDRYNGKDFKKYPAPTPSQNPNFPLSQDELKIDESGTLWGIGKRGLLYRYNITCDRFDTLILADPIIPQTLTYVYLAPDRKAWLCNKNAIYLYDINRQTCCKVHNSNPYSITDITYAGKELFYIGTECGFFLARLSNNTLTPLQYPQTETIPFRIQKLYYNTLHGKLFIGTLRDGAYLYDPQSHRLKDIEIPQDIQIMKFAAYGQDQRNILIATLGGGIYRYDMIQEKTEPFLPNKLTTETGMNAYNINDLYIDEKQRIWASVYSTGITLCTYLHPNCHWIRHSDNNIQTLANNRVNHIIEDSDGDLWFATDEGISLYRKKERHWEHYLSDKQTGFSEKNRTCLALCEIRPGIIMVGGCMSGLYQIDKRQKKAHRFSYGKKGNKYIRSILKDEHGNIWTGGYDKIEKIDWENKKCEAFPTAHPITCMAEKDEKSIWAGTTEGLYILNKENGKMSAVKLPAKRPYISTICRDKYGSIYIGTCGNGLFAYHPKRKTAIIYRPKNTWPALDIYAIIPYKNGDLLLSTEEGIIRYRHSSHSFTNWNTESDRTIPHFNYNACLQTQENTFIFGSDNGAVEFSDEAMLPASYEGKITLSQFQAIPKKSLYLPEEKPVSIDIRKQQKITLPYSQNIFSLRITSIGYDHPENILYTWKMEDSHHEWSIPSSDNLIQYANLLPGKHILRIRSVVRGSLAVLDEKTVEIYINPPFWGSVWGKATFALILFSIGGGAFRYARTKHRKRQQEKILLYHEKQGNGLLLADFPESGMELPDNISETDILFIRRVKETIEAHIATPGFTIDLLAASLNMSRSNFFKKWKKLTKQAPHILIRNIRLNKAAELLQKRQYTITEIADITGFCDVKYFRKLFKQHFGCTPSDMLKKESKHDRHSI